MFVLKGFAGNEMINIEINWEEPLENVEWNFGGGNGLEMIFGKLNGNFSLKIWMCYIFKKLI